MERLRTKIRWTWNYFWRVIKELCRDLWNYYVSPYPILLAIGALRRIHRRFKIIWLAKSPGRPCIHEKIVDLIIEMKRCNLIWGGQRISDELKILGISVSKKTVLKILKEHGFIPPKTKFAPPSWKSLLNSYSRFWSMDFTTVFDAKGTQLFVFAIIEYPSRLLIQIGVTTNPNKLWLTQQLRNCAVTGHQFPNAMVHDRDGVYGNWLPEILGEFKMSSIKTQVRSPSLPPAVGKHENCYIERFNLSIKTEILNRMAIIDTDHARELCQAYRAWYNEKRPHQGIDGQIPAQKKVIEKNKPNFDKMRIKKELHLNGLVTHFSLAA